jgi:hypothetical protein
MSIIEHKISWRTWSMYTKVWLPILAIHSTTTRYNHKLLIEFDETCIQVGRQSEAKVLARRGSNVVYNITPKSWKWLIINWAINATNVILLRFYTFIGERLRNDYIKLCKLKRCMVVQKKAWMTFFVQKVLIFLQETWGTTRNGFKTWNWSTLI